MANSLYTPSLTHVKLCGYIGRTASWNNWKFYFWYHVIFSYFTNDMLIAKLLVVCRDKLTPSVLPSPSCGFLCCRWRLCRRSARSLNDYSAQFHTDNNMESAFLENCNEDDLADFFCSFLLFWICHRVKKSISKFWIGD